MVQSEEERVRVTRVEGTLLSLHCVHKGSVITTTLVKFITKQKLELVPLILREINHEIYHEIHLCGLICVKGKVSVLKSLEFGFCIGGSVR